MRMVHQGDEQARQHPIGGERSPEEVAREFIRREGSFEEPEDTGGIRKGRVAVIGIVLAVITAAVVVLATRSGPTSGPTSARATAQMAANAKALAAGCSANPRARANEMTFRAPAHVIQPRTLYAATVVTTAGTFRIGMNSLGAPNALNDFLFLAEKGYFNCNTFFYVSSDGIDRTGDPTGSGVGQPGYSIPAERPAPAPDPTHQYPVGSVALANYGPLDAGGGQWFVVAGPAAESLPNKYSLFGRVIAGFRVIQKINAEGSVSGKPTVLERVLKVTIQRASV